MIYILQQKKKKKKKKKNYDNYDVIKYYKHLMLIKELKKKIFLYYPNNPYYMALMDYNKNKMIKYSNATNNKLDK